MDDLLIQINTNLQNGKSKAVAELVQQALDAGIAPESILDDGLLAGMSAIGTKFKNNEVFVPEVLVAARAMKKGAEVLQPILTAAGIKAKARPLSAPCRATCTISARTWLR